MFPRRLRTPVKAVGFGALATRNCKDTTPSTPSLALRDPGTTTDPHNKAARLIMYLNSSRLALVGLDQSKGSRFGTPLNCAREVWTPA